MHDVAELTMLLREHIDLPNNLTIKTEEFREGWNLVRAGDMQWLDKEIRAQGWHFIWIADNQTRSGIGHTPQEAISAALKLTLRHVDKRFNAAEVEHISFKKYPWFFLATVRVYPCQIQMGAALSASDAIPLSLISPPAKAVMPSKNQVAPTV